MDRTLSDDFLTLNVLQKHARALNKVRSLWMYSSLFLVILIHAKGQEIEGVSNEGLTLNPAAETCAMTEQPGVAPDHLTLNSAAESAHTQVGQSFKIPAFLHLTNMAPFAARFVVTLYPVNALQKHARSMNKAGSLRMYPSLLLVIRIHANG